MAPTDDDDVDEVFVGNDKGDAEKPDNEDDDDDDALADECDA